MELLDLLKRIDENKKEIDGRRPLSPYEAKQLDAYYRIGTTYSSNALEGNSLTLTETKVLLEDGITIGGKPIRDCYEATSHAQAYDLMLEAARSKPFELSEDTILRLHKLFYNRIDSEKAGMYRNERVFITGTEYLPPLPEEVPTQMRAFIGELNEKWGKTHPVALSAYAHRRLVDIHPFIDGNGRVARLLMNLIVINRGYQIISIPPILRTDYINALEAARSGSPTKREMFDRFIAECEIESQRDYCRMFHITLPKKDNRTRT
ncbi:MAG: Fic family protein [Oscillospiraceae bacterium]|nr:Fic family protein [Oscillospiraceae bacterium]